MASPGEQPESGKRTLPPPPQPRRAITDITKVVVYATGIWFALFCGMLVSVLGFDTGPPILLWTCAAGWGLGLIGLAIMRWQRAAARRGNRRAQTGLS